MSQLICKNLLVGYEGKAILDPLNFEIHTGDYLCVVGENGAGKSTLMKALLGLQQPISGQIEMGDGLRRNEIGYLPQQTIVQRDFPASVQEIVLSGCQSRCGLRPFYSREESSLRRMPCTNADWIAGKCCYRELSGGQQQRVLLARALCATRKMLLLDEPVSGLDPKVTTEMYHLIEKLNQQEGITVLMISHDIQAAVCYASHILHVGETYLFRHTGSVSAKLAGAAVCGWERRCRMNVLEKLIFYWNYPFVRYALIVGVLIALCSSLLGVTLVLKRFSFIGDGLSHVAFGGMAIATVLGMSDHMPLTLAVTVACAVLLLHTGQNTQIKGDAAIAMVSVGALAMGYLLMNLFSTSANLSGDVCSTLFGSTSILTLTKSEVWLCIGLSIIVVAVFMLFYNKIFAVTFDETFAQAVGTNANGYNLLIAIVIAVIIVLAMNLVGSLLISALVIFPALSAMRLCKNFRAVTICSAVLSVSCAFVGIVASVLAGTPVGSTIVAVDMAAFGLCCLAGKLLGRAS